MLPSLLIRQASRHGIFFSEVVQREEIHQPVISDYLEGLVRRGLIPRPIAEVINRFSDMNVQREAVTLFWAKQRAQAWEERRQRSERFRTASNAFGYAVAGLCAVVLIKEMPFSHPAVPSIHQPLLVTPVHSIPPISLASHVHRHVKNRRSQAAAVLPRSAKISSAAPAIHSNVPENFAVRSRSTGVLFSWHSMGPGYTYTLYSGDEPAMRRLHKEKDRISGTSYMLDIRKAQKAGSWWAITATNAYGGEGPLSGAVNSSP